jgi:uncharacterized membrane protein
MRFIPKDPVIIILSVLLLLFFALLPFYSSTLELRQFRPAGLFFSAVLNALLVGFLSTVVVIFGVRVLDDTGSNHNWSQTTKRRINYGFLLFSALLIILLVNYLSSKGGSW